MNSKHHQYCRPVKVSVDEDESNVHWEYSEQDECDTHVPTSLYKLGNDHIIAFHREKTESFEKTRRFDLCVEVQMKSGQSYCRDIGSNKTPSQCSRMVITLLQQLQRRIA